MGFWRAVGSFLGVPTRRFDSTPQLVDRLFRSLLAASATGGPVTREDALAVPAVQQGRRMIGAVATLPLAAYRLADWVQVDNPLLRQIDPDVPNVITIGQTLDDLIFESLSWWRVTSRDFDGFPMSARHLDLSSVTVQQAGGRTMPAPLPSGIDPRGATVYVDGVPTSWADLIRFDSPSPPLLTVGARAIRRALALDLAAEMYANDPKPLDYFSPVEGADPVGDDAVQDLLNQWRRARQNRSTGYVPAALKYNEVAAPSPQELQLVELQRQATLDIANAMGGDAEDFGVSTTSRTYANAVDRRQDKVNTTLAPFMRAVTDRLSMGDVTRRGYVVRFDLDDFLKANPTDRWAVYGQAKAMGAMGVSEIRTKEKLGPLPADAEPTPAPAPAAPSGDANASPEPVSGDVTSNNSGQPEEAEASHPAAHTFDGGRGFTFDAELTEFAVDASTRVIEGIALPYGRLAKGFVFEAGSLQWTDPTRVKLLRDHDPRQAIGYAEALTNTPKGLKVRFKVARGAAGDEALQLAEDRVLDGLSVGTDFELDADTVPHPKHKGALLVRRADLRETSLTAVPAFDDARVTKVAASRDQGETVSETTTEPTTAPADPAVVPGPVTFTADQAAQFTAFQAWQASQPAAESERPTVVNPTRQIAVTATREALPYQFSYQGGRHVFRSDAEHDFSTDLFTILRAQKDGGDFTAPLGRVNGMIRAAFADVEIADVTALNPNQHRPDMWQPQMDYATPLWDMVGAGTTDGTKFDVPKFTSSSALVGPATEKTEPAGGSMVVELQTITPSQVWGKVEITRQAWRAGGTPQLSGILWDQMLREYYEDREAAVATFLNTLTAATDIALTGTPVASPTNDHDQTTSNDLEMAIAALQFVRGGNRFRSFAAHIDLYKVLARVKDDAGRPLYPMRNPQNANGVAADLFGTLNVAGSTVVPSWALGATGIVSANSWLFDPAKVRGWASAPERLFWDFGATVQTANIPQLSFVTLGIYGDVAFANTDIAGVRQVTFDPSV